MSCPPPQHKQSNRRGAIAVLAAILVVPLLILAAFVIDLGYILVAKQEMQKAADSAALAGAAKVLVAQPSGNPNSNALASAGVSSAVSEAQKFCVLNAARGVNLTLLSSNVVVGYVANPANSASALVPWLAGNSYPNAVKVTVRRDGTVNTPIPLFLANLIGMSTWSGNATATACASRSYTLTGFNSPTMNNLLLPLAIDVNFWNTFMTTGKSTDGLVHDDYTANAPSSTNPTPNNVTSGGDNVPEFTDVYPNKGSPGNFGLICIGTPANSTPAFSNWIDNGSSPSDMAYFGGNGIQATASSPLTMKGGPGLKAICWATCRALSANRALCRSSPPIRATGATRSTRWWVLPVLPSCRHRVTAAICR